METPRSGRNESIGNFVIHQQKICAEFETVAVRALPNSHRSTEKHPLTH